MSQTPATYAATSEPFISLLNLDAATYLDVQIAKMHPNAQRMFTPKLAAEHLANVKISGEEGMDVQSWLKTQKWDSIQQWFRVGFPHMIECAEQYQKRLACEGSGDTCHCHA